MLGPSVQGRAALEVDVERREPEESDPAAPATVEGDGSAREGRAKARRGQAEVRRGLVELHPRRGRGRGVAGSGLFWVQSNHNPSSMAAL